MDRRKTIDFWAKLLLGFNILAWGLLIALLFMFHRAQPEFETFFDRFYHLKLRTDWDMQFLYYLIYSVIFGVFFSFSGLVLSFFRGRRKQDHKKSLIVTGIISLIMLWVSLNVL
ncbi:MAG: hypothetical protein GY699_07520 [Desulfobacteraceae bacterium]|nr:hypothetical protein [Desulfobacteraceae bacterium]